MPVKKPAAPAPVVPPLFRAALKAAGLPMPVAEYEFAKEEGRKFRWDFAWPENVQQVWHDIYVSRRLALEVQGGVWSRGAHGRGTGITRDMEKFSLGAALGWRLLLVEPKALCTQETMSLIRRALDV